MEDNFDPKNFHVPPEAAKPNHAAWAAKAKAGGGGGKAERWWKGREGSYVIVSVSWFDRAVSVLKAASETAVVLGIFHRMGFSGTTVEVTAEIMRRRGVSSKTRNRTLRKLEAAGLISVEWRKVAAPRVTVHLDAEPRRDADLQAALGQVVASTGIDRFRPAALLSHLKAQPDYPATAPQNVTQLLDKIRQIDPRWVGIRRGYQWVFLPGPAR
jgi:DNA-binding HxlR family transcriptional regulator